MRSTIYKLFRFIKCAQHQHPNLTINTPTCSAAKSSLKKFDRDQRRLDKHLYGLYARVYVWENSGMQLFFSVRSSKVKVSNFKQPLLGSVKVREVF